ncbi:MAG: GNAT family N-acetyltransferase [Sedimentisphaerales bacterium]|nr:GNAT family N-acetyltransferase [Sedimentisphaerales bacterium]
MASREPFPVRAATLKGPAHEVPKLFVKRGYRRCGIGREAIDILRRQVCPARERLTVDVLTANEAGIAFWRSVGFTDYCLTLEVVPDVP